LIDFDAMDTDRDGRIGEDELVDALGRRYRGGRKPQD
jgi:Ca2+-binding EF-hand superfamily protein